jgi:oxygen-independent coproporphyrinogen-3 oxidase
LKAVASAGSGESLRSTLSADERAEEYLMMAMRLREGADLARFARLAGRDVDDLAIAGLRELGLVEREGDILRTTAAGRPVLNGVLRALLA